MGVVSGCVRAVVWVCVGVAWGVWVCGRAGACVCVCVCVCLVVDMGVVRGRVTEEACGCVGVRVWGLFFLSIF